MRPSHGRGSGFDSRSVHLQCHTAVELILMNVLFIVDVGKESGIYTYAMELKEVLEQKGILVDVDKTNAKKYDLIHVHNAFPSLFLFKSLVQLYNVPIVYSANMTENQLQGMTPVNIKMPAKQYLQFFYSRCAKIFCPSEQIMEELKAHKNRTILLPYPVDLNKFRKDRGVGESFRKKYGIPFEKKVVLCVASIQERKGIFDFLEIAENFPEHQFVWVGTIPQIRTLKYKRKLQKIVANPPANILFTGHIEREQLAETYNAADLFVLPSYSETFGLVIAEAASCGVPVIIRKLPEFSYFSDFALQFSSQEKFKEQVKKVLENENEGKNLQQLSLNARKKFDIEEHVKKVIEIYYSVL